MEVPDPKIRDFFVQGTAFSHTAKEVIIRNGDTPRGVYYLTHGLVKVVGFSKNGDELTLNIFKPFSYFPLTWALSHVPNRYTFQAMTAVAGFRVTAEAIETFLATHPDSLFALTKRLLTGLAGLQERVEFLMKDHADTKLVSACILLARRFGLEQGTQLRIELPVTHQELAAMAGISRETVTRKLSQLKKRGLIDWDQHHLIITNPQAFMDIDLPI